MHGRIIELCKDVSETSRRSLSEISRVTQGTKTLAINAMIESARAGEAGRGFSIVAKEVGSVSNQINRITDALQTKLATQIGELDRVSAQMIQQTRGMRLADLSLNMIEIMDRNLYERSCDVRWWATDSAVVQAAQMSDNPGATDFAIERLGVILDNYTVYADLWIADTTGRVIATGRPGKFPAAGGANVATAPWFQNALSTRDGTQFVVDDIYHCDPLARNVATYATAIRENGQTTGKVVGVLGVFFDWTPQSQTIVKSLRLSDDERAITRAMLIDAEGRVLAASDEQGILSERFRLRHEGKPSGFYTDSNGKLVGFALTPGYETYKGLGWYGVIVQNAQA